MWHVWGDSRMHGSQVPGSKHVGRSCGQVRACAVRGLGLPAREVTHAAMAGFPIAGAALAVQLSSGRRSSTEQQKSKHHNANASRAPACRHLATNALPCSRLTPTSRGPLPPNRNGASHRVQCELSGANFAAVPPSAQPSKRARFRPPSRPRPAPAEPVEGLYPVPAGDTLPSPPEKPLAVLEASRAK